MSQTPTFEVNKIRFLQAIWEVKSKTDMDINTRLEKNKMSYARYKMWKQGRVTLDTLEKLRSAGVEVSKFMKREDFINLYGNE